MKSSRSAPEWLRHWGLAMLLALSAGLAACSDTSSEMPSAEVMQPVRLVRAEPYAAIVSRRLTGRIAPVRTLDLSFQVSGRIAELPVPPGTLVAAGGLIARLDAVDFELRLRQAEVERSLAEKTADRARRMVETRGGSRAALDAANTEVELAQVALELARQQFAYSRIDAPFDALVTRRLQEEHANVDAFAAVIRVQDVTELRVHVDLPEALLPLLEAPERFRIKALPQAYPGRSFELNYREHITEANAFAQTYRVAFGMPRPNAPVLLPGMTVTVVITPIHVHGEERGGSPRLPLMAVDSDPSGAFRIWIFDSDTSVVTPRQVVLGGTSRGLVEIVSGVTQGEQVVVAGVDALRPGMRVRPLGDGLQ